MTDVRTRVSVPLKDFLNVTVKLRDEFDTPEKAAAELGYTSVDSFKQALTRNRKRYPAIFEGVPKYTSTNGLNVPSEEEALALLAELGAPADEGEENEETKEGGDTPQ